MFSRFIGLGSSSEHQFHCDKMDLVYRERSHLQQEDLGCYKNECQLEDL